MRIYEIMTRDVVTATENTSVATAITQMVDRRIGALPIIDDKRRVIGIVTESDFLRRVETGTGNNSHSAFMTFLLSSGRLAEEYVDTHSRRLGDLMTTDVITIDEGSRLLDLINLFEKHEVRRIPVTCQGILIGIVTRFDLVRLLAQKFGASIDAGSDVAIRERLRLELGRHIWASNVSITVKDKVITLDGVVTDERCRKALNVAARNVGEGVIVRDNMTWIEPVGGVIV